MVWCHVRGGGELGEEWHYQGRAMKKMNSFLDAKACADYLVEKGISTSDVMAIHGSSAGGLLVWGTLAHT